MCSKCNGCFEEPKTAEELYKEAERRKKDRDKEGSGKIGISTGNPCDVCKNRVDSDGCALKYKTGIVATIKEKLFGCPGFDEIDVEWLDRRTP